MEKARQQTAEKPRFMLILASKSPTRKTLLQNAGLHFMAAPASLDERALEATVMSRGGDKIAVASALAHAKAEIISLQHPQAIVIGADQVLECADLDVHKPANRQEAAMQLRQMAGKTHFIHSAVALVKKGQTLWRTTESAELHLKAFSETELDTVLDLEGDAILSSVGGYRLEGPSVRLFESVRGDYFTVLGLPLLPLLAALQRHAPEMLAGRATQ